jgi:uncharacterized membrane protein YeaQ/YmgE (transglycosylase-associated protein family)
MSPERALEARMDFLIAIVIGGIIGWVASMIMGTDAQMGIIANILVGIIGSWLGHVLAPKLGIAEDSQVIHWLVAIGGAVLLIIILKALRIFR